MSHRHEYLLGPKDRVRLQKDWCEGYAPHVTQLMLSLRGTIVETDETARECAYHVVEWDSLPDEDLEKIFSGTAPHYLDLSDMVQGDMLEPAEVDGNFLLSRHSEGSQNALRAAVTALYLYDGQMNRSVSGAFYDIVESLDTNMFNELRTVGADDVFKKYFSEDDED